MNYKDLNILLVDDDRVDVLAVKEALEENNIANPVFVANDGAAALALLRGRPGQDPIPEPFIILLDLNMPRMNGIEFLQEVRRDPKLKSTVVFVLTTSRDDRDKLAAYEHNVAGYVVKADVGKDFIHLISLLKDYKIVVQFPLSRAH